MEPALGPLRVDHLHDRRPEASGPACLAMARAALGESERADGDALEALWRDVFPEALGPEAGPVDGPTGGGLALAALRAGLHVTFHGAPDERDAALASARDAGLLLRAGSEAGAVLRAALEAGHPVLAVTSEHGGTSWVLVLGDTPLGLDVHDPLEPTGPLQLPHDQFARAGGRGPFLELATGVRLRR